MKRAIPLAVVLLPVLAFTSLATPLCGIDFFAGYVALGSAGCQINDKIFYDFTLISAVATGGATAVGAADMTITPVVQAGAAIANPGPGIMVTANWTATNGQTVDTTIAYRVKIAPEFIGKYILTDAHLSIVGTASGNAAAGVSENVISEMDSQLRLPSSSRVTRASRPVAPRTGITPRR